MDKLPCITPDLPGIGGKIKERPEHFIVEELPLYRPEGSGQHLYINLTRENLTTLELQKKLADLFGLRPSSVGFAGIKDKHARTTQTFSLMVGRAEEGFLNTVKKKIEESLPVTVNWASLHRNKLRRGHLLGNRFAITITGLSEPKKALVQARKIADRLKRTGLPNYFGPQRFSKDNIRRGLDIIKGKKTGSRWLRRFFISSYQSYLCNCYLARRLEMGLFDRILPGDIAKKYSTGGLFQVKDVREARLRYERGEISFTAPIFGSRMRPATGPARELEQAVLEQSDVTLEQLREAGAKGTRRLGRLLVQNLELKLVPEGLLLTFSLPKGAFATTVLREIMKNDFIIK